MDGKLLDIKNLEVQYVTDEETVYAVNGIDISLNEGETLGLVGETGAGKTTTALGIMRLVPNPPGKIMGGEIIYEGENLLKLPEEEMRKIRGNKISMIFQDPMTSLNPVMTVGEQIAEVIQIHENITTEESMKRQEKCWNWLEFRQLVSMISSSILRWNETTGCDCHCFGMQS